MRTISLFLFSFQFDDINDLAVYLHSEKITCEKLIFHFPQKKRSIPPGLIAILKPLKLVIHPCSVYHNNIVLGSYDHAAVNVVSFTFVIFNNELFLRSIYPLFNYRKKMWIERWQCIVFWTRRVFLFIISMIICDKTNHNALKTSIATF